MTPFFRLDNSIYTRTHIIDAGLTTQRISVFRVREGELLHKVRGIVCTTCTSRCLLEKKHGPDFDHNPPPRSYLVTDCPYQQVNTQGGRYLRVLVGNVEASDEQLRLGAQRADCRVLQSIMNHLRPPTTTFNYI